MQHNRKVHVATAAFLVFYLALVSIAAAAGAITLTPTAQAPGASITVEGTGFGVTKAVGLGFGAEVNVTGEDVNATGPYGVGVGPYVYALSYLPVKPGSFRMESGFMLGGSYVPSFQYWDNGDGTISTNNTQVVWAVIDYTTGKAIFNFTVPLSSSVTYVRMANYTRYEYNVTPAAGVTTLISGAFTASITVPAVANGNYNVTAIDTQGNRAVAAFTATTTPTPTPSSSPTPTPSPSPSPTLTPTPSPSPTPTPTTTSTPTPTPSSTPTPTPTSSQSPTPAPSPFTSDLIVWFIALATIGLVIAVIGLVLRSKRAKSATAAEVKLSLNTRAIALTIVFTALSIALTPIAIPAGYIPFLYRFWEIPIVAAFLLFGPKIGVTVAVLRATAEPFIGPASVLGSVTSLGGTLSMLLGVYVAGWMLKRKAAQDGSSIKSGTCFTTLGGLFRMLVAPFVMYPVWRFIYALSDAVIIGLAPPSMLFAFTLCLYTIPIGYLIAKIVNKTLAVGNRL